MAPKSIVYRLFSKAREAKFWCTDNLQCSMMYQKKLAWHQDFCYQACGTVPWPVGNTDGLCCLVRYLMSQVCGDGGVKELHMNEATGGDVETAAMLCNDSAGCTWVMLTVWRGYR